LSDLGDQLEAFLSAVNIELFLPDGADGRRAATLRPMFKILIIQMANNLSDERVEFLINDRLSFMRFLGLGVADRVPDARTIWLFREKLTAVGAIKGLLARFDALLRQAGCIAMSGQIVDASLVAAPRQRNTDGRLNTAGRSGNPAIWLSEPHLDRSRFHPPMGGHETRLPMRAVVCAKACSIRAIRRAGCGPILPTDAANETFLPRMGLSATSIARSRKAALCWR
jgi:IS5 family transposase